MANSDWSSGLVKARDSDNPLDNARYFAKLSCYMSHLESMMELAARGTKKGQIYLVVEDDWEVIRDLGGMLPDIAWAVNDDWDAIRLDCWDTWDGTHGRGRVYRTKQQQNGNYGGSHAVLYRSETVAKVAEYFRKEPFKEVDALLWTEKLNTYCVNWGIMHRMAQFGSNINHVKSTSRRLISADVEPIDAYVMYQNTTLHQRPHRKQEFPTREQLEKQREEHAKKCREERSNLRLELGRLVKAPVAKVA